MGAHDKQFIVVIFCVLTFTGDLSPSPVPTASLEDRNAQQSSGEGEESPPLEDRGESNTQQESTKGTVQQPNGDAAPPSVNNLQEQAPHLGDSGQNQNSLENHQVNETG